MRLLNDALWSPAEKTERLLMGRKESNQTKPAGKGLTSWLSFVMSNCEFVIFPSVSLVRCGA